MCLASHAVLDGILAEDFTDGYRRVFDRRRIVLLLIHNVSNMVGMLERAASETKGTTSPNFNLILEVIGPYVVLIRCWS